MQVEISAKIGSLCERGSIKFSKFKARSPINSDMFKYSITFTRQRAIDIPVAQINLSHCSVWQKQQEKMKNKQIRLDITDDTFQSDYPRILCEMRSRVSTERIWPRWNVAPRSCTQLRVIVSLINRIPRVRCIRS